MRPTWAEINLKAVQNNYKITRDLAGSSTSVMAIVKADAYGHGAAEISEILSRSGVEMFGVATLEEAMELRENGIVQPVVILGGIQPDETECVVENGFIPTVYDKSTLEHLQRAVSGNNIVCRYHIKIDTGMSRLGFLKGEVDDLIDAVSTYENLVPEGIFTHFAAADENDRSYTEYQISEFNQIVKRFDKAGVYPKFVHMANSAAIQRFPESICNMVRPGIMIYGACSFNDTKLEPVMSVKSRIIQIKKIPQDTSVSYGCRFRTKRETTIAILPVGYADGYLRNLSNRAYVSFKGQRVPVIGSICMDFTILDVTDVQGAKVGDVAVLFGDDNISIEEVARWGNTIPYEIMTIVGKRVRKVFR